MARLIVLTDPAVTVRVHETTAQRVLEKNVPTVMAFPVTLSHVHNVENVQRLAEGIVPPTVTVLHDLIVLTAQAMQIEVNEENDLPMEIVHNVENALHTGTVRSAESVPLMVIVQTGENALAMETAMVRHVEIAYAMETAMVRHVVNVLSTAAVMAHLEVIVPTVPLVTVPHMATVETGMRVQNAEVSVVVAQAEPLAANDQVEIVEGSLLLVTAVHVQNVLIVQHTVIVLNVEIVLPMVIAFRVLNVQNVLPTGIVHNAETVLLTETATEHLEAIVPAMVIVGPVQTVGESALHMVIVGLVRNALSVLPTVIVRNVEIVPHMVTEVHAQIAGVIVLLMVSVQSDHVLEIAVDARTVLVLHALGVVILVVVMTALLVGKSQNLPKSSAWRENFEWFARTTMTPGLMTMSQVMNSTRLPATN